MSGFCRDAIAYLKAAPDARGQGRSLPAHEAPVLRPIGHGLAVAYVVDKDDALVFVQQRHLMEEGIDADALHRIGMKNLMARSNGGYEVKRHGPVHAVFFDGNFEASLLLTGAVWNADLAHLVDNDFVAAIPARDVLAFCDSGSAEGIAELRQIVERLKPDGAGRGDHLLTPTLFKRQNGKWTPFPG